VWLKGDHLVPVHGLVDVTENGTFFSVHLYNRFMPHRLQVTLSLEDGSEIVLRNVTTLDTTYTYRFTIDEVMRQNLNAIFIWRVDVLAELVKLAVPNTRDIARTYFYVMRLSKIIVKYGYYRNMLRLTGTNVFRSFTKL